MKIEFDTTEVLSEEDIKQIATETVKEAFQKQLKSNNSMINISFFIYEGVIRDLLKDKEAELLQMVNKRIDEFKLDDWDIKHNTNVEQLINESIQSRKSEFVTKANEQIDIILAEEDWKYNFLSDVSEFLQEVFISNMYDSIKPKR